MIQKLHEIADSLVTAAAFFILGAVIGIGQLVMSGEKVTVALALARAATTGGLATAGGAIVIWQPDASLIGQIGLAAALASLGTSGLEKLFAWLINRRKL